MSRDDCIRLEKEDGEHLFGRNTTIQQNKCIGLVQSLMGTGKNVVWGEEEEMGYYLLVCSSIYQTTNMLKENTYEVSIRQTQYILQELYLGQIQKRLQDSRQYDRYTFTSIKCTHPPEGELVCVNCATARNSLR